MSIRSHTSSIWFFVLLAISPALMAMPDVLPAEEAYQFSAEIIDAKVHIHASMPDGYYLYKKKIKINNGDLVKFDKIVFPVAETKEDKYFGVSEIFRNEFSFNAPFQVAAESSSLTFTLHWQGCTDFGFCYPPKKTKLTLALPIRQSTTNEIRGKNLLAELTNDPMFGSGQTFLPADEAFQVNVLVNDPFRVDVTWQIAKGYYLYKDKIKFSTESKYYQVGTPSLEPGQAKFDEHFGDTEVYYLQTKASLPILRASPDPFDANITVHYQGCAEDGICYPPISKTLPVIFAAANPLDQPSINPNPISSNETTELSNLIRDGSLLWIILSFLVLGVLLTFTPCVLPMIPILSGVIMGQDKLNTGRAFRLSLTYVLAMSAAYTLAGVLVAMLGQNLQTTFQNPWILYGFVLLFVVFGLSMFDVFELKMPGFVQNWASRNSQSQRSGSYLGVASMGVLSALVVGPCIAAPLAAALIVIGQTGDPLRGGLALFSLSLGMGVPLLIFGTSIGKFVPKAGGWMQHIKALFGFMMFGLCIWMLARLWPANWIMFAYALLLLSIAIYCFSKLKPKFNLAFGLLALLYSGALAYGAVIGSVSPLHPLTESKLSVTFKTIKSVKDLDRELARARDNNQGVLLDFYADWCVACKEMEHLTFTDIKVQARMSEFVLLQSDVTANDAKDQALMDRYKVFGPPTILVFDELGREQSQQRVIGFLNAEKFLTHLNQL